MQTSRLEAGEHPGTPRGGGTVIGCARPVSLLMNEVRCRCSRGTGHRTAPVRRVWRSGPLAGIGVRWALAAVGKRLSVVTGRRASVSSWRRRPLSGNVVWRGSRVRMRPPGVLAHERGAILLQSLRRAPAGAGATHMGCRSRQRRSGRAAGHASAEAGWRQGGGAEVRAQSIAARAAGFLAMRQSGRSSAAVSAPYPQVAAMKGRALASAELPSSSRSPM